MVVWMSIRGLIFYFAPNPISTDTRPSSLSLVRLFSLFIRSSQTLEKKKHKKKTLWGKNSKEKNQKKSKPKKETNSWDRNSNRPTLSKGQRKEIRWWVLLWRRFVVRRSDKIKRRMKRKKKELYKTGTKREKKLKFVYANDIWKTRELWYSTTTGKIYPFSRLGEWEKSSTSRRTKSDFVLIFTPILTNLQLYSLFLVCSQTKWIAKGRMRKKSEWSSFSTKDFLGEGENCGWMRRKVILSSNALDGADEFFLSRLRISGMLIAYGCVRMLPNI